MVAAEKAKVGGCFVPKLELGNENKGLADNELGNENKGLADNELGNETKPRWKVLGHKGGPGGFGANLQLLPFCRDCLHQGNVLAVHRQYMVQEPVPQKTQHVVQLLDVSE